ncbi:PIG-L deacetylase family protein [Pseudomonas japonica]|uniref:PIG-L deacetylase family protein n=1 Tax=Pseudomonas japonica TaxID=256466 RepID=UPI0015E272D0|nr:PIG-L family deacetylase [Pseudomonas japonica]MBA1243079.1 PIG-L family deacetylase [Pseudomonas japonica]
MSRKQALLKRHRRNKRVALLAGVVVLVLAGVFLAWWVPILLGMLGWMAHEAWFADHLFYSPRQDYQYRFPEGAGRLDTLWEGGTLSLGEPLPGTQWTVIAQVNVRSTWLGRFLDPVIEIDAGTDKQTFERGCAGLRYLNLSAHGPSLGEGVRLAGRFCRISGTPKLWAFAQPDYREQRLMIIAPHADDAELAAFGLYSQARDRWIVTLTAGEIEAEHYQAMGLGREDAARLKGRLRAWDSVTVPRWGGVPESRCVQLGYFCLQLEAMRAAPQEAVASREAGMADTRLFRQFNPLALPGDDGRPCWDNLIADLRALISLARPDVIVLPHTALDPHPDHIQAHHAVREALQGLEWQPSEFLGYANHLHDNDRWPMGSAHDGVALPPAFDSEAIAWPVSLPVEAEARMNKAMALGMMHDLQPPLPFKRRLRRALQRVLAARRWAVEGENEFFRKAVRRHELFWRLDP